LLSIFDSEPLISHTADRLMYKNIGCKALGLARKIDWNISPITT